MGYPETADIETSSDEYATRFSGDTGQWLLDVQSKIVQELLVPHSIRTVLDVGGGHGQLAYPLNASGYHVTVVGSDSVCVHRISELVNSGAVAFSVGNLIDLPHQDSSFDAVTCIRFIPHCERWQELISEVCRVARNLVIVDYPPVRSFNIFYRLLFKLKHRAEGNTRPYAVFSDSEIATVFKENGFVPARRKPQFFLPMVIHRRLKNPSASAALEGFFRLTGLTYIFGSPTIASFVRSTQ